MKNIYKHPDDLVTVARDGDVAIVTMNEPVRRNVFSSAMCHALRDAFDYLSHQDEQIRSVVLTGAGEDFCVGGDQSEMTTSASVVALRSRMDIAIRMFKSMFNCSKPIVAAVEGHCIGAGLSLASAADLVVSSRAAEYSCAFVKVNLLPDTGILWTLPHRIGHGMARELMMTGRRFDAQEALEMGAVSELAEPGEALKTAIERAREFSRLPPVTLALLKSALIDGMNTLADTKNMEMNLNPLVRLTEDHLEAVNAFMEKRTPLFTGN